MFGQSREITTSPVGKETGVTLCIELFQKYVDPSLFITWGGVEELFCGGEGEGFHGFQGEFLSNS